MSVAAIGHPREAKMTIPIDTFLELDRKVQDVRLRLLSPAEKFESEVQQLRSVKEALRTFAEKGDLPNRSPDNSPRFILSQDVYVFLDDRLHNLRVLAISTAELIARQNHEEVVGRTHLDAAWQHIIAGGQLRRTALQ